MKHMKYLSAALAFNANFFALKLPDFFITVFKNLDILENKVLE
jgi:hypothetical protein